MGRTSASASNSRTPALAFVRFLALRLRIIMRFLLSSGFYCFF